MARAWVFKENEERRSAPGYRLVRKGEEPKKRWLTIAKADPPTQERLIAELRKQIAELTPEERARLAKAVNRTWRIGKAADAADRVAEAGIREVAAEGRVLDLERQDGTSKLLGDGVTRLDLRGEVKKSGRKGYLDMPGITPAPDKPATRNLRDDL
jgi:hypothetical protein